MSGVGPMSSQVIDGIVTMSDNYDRRIRYVAELLQVNSSLRSRDLAKIIGVTPSHLERLLLHCAAI